MSKISALQLGKAGEYLVCADLILQCYVAYLSEQGLHYDVVTDIDGNLIRIQVKSTFTYKQAPQRKRYSPFYIFNARRCGKGGRSSYSNQDVDIIALVSLKNKVIGYIPINEVKQTMCFRVRGYQYKGRGAEKRGRYLEDFTFERALNEIS